MKILAHASSLRRKRRGIEPSEIEMQHNRTDSHLYLAAAYSQLGQRDEAEWEIAEILTLDPGFSLKQWARYEPYQDPAQLERFLNDLREVGVPE